MATIPAIEPVELSSALDSHDNIFVVDVRDEDEFSEGHIPHAINVPSKTWTDESVVADLAERHSDGSHTIVFHCSRSEHRGPKFAAVFANAFKEKQVQPNIKILKGGYLGWKAAFESDESKIEKSS